MNDIVEVPTVDLGERLTIRRMATGLWQVAGGHGKIDFDAAVAAMEKLYRRGFTSFDMADHYGPAEEIAGAFAQRVRRGGKPVDESSSVDGGSERHDAMGAPDAPQIFTKWVPEPGPVTPETVRAAVDRARTRLHTDRIDLLQFHWWDYLDPGYIPAMEALANLREEGIIGEIGLTNFDTAHARILTGMGIPVASNQVHFSLLDSRAAGEMSALCASSGMKLLCYGTLAGGFLSDRWLGRPEPSDEDTAGSWSLMKYHRFIRTFGGWELFQQLLAVLSRIAGKHKVGISNVATRWVMDHHAVAAVLIGTRLGLSDHTDDNIRTLALTLDDEDRRAIDAVRAEAGPIPGDCGDEYRKPPFLTAAGDLSDHKTRSWREPVVPVDAAGPTVHARYTSGTTWEKIASFSRAVRRGDRIVVSGTTATLQDRVVPPGDATAQTDVCIDKIQAAVEALGGTLEDVIRTRIFVPHVERDWESVARAHGRRFAGIEPANTLVGAPLVGDGYLVEMEAEAVIPSKRDA